MIMLFLCGAGKKFEKFNVTTFCADAMRGKEARQIAAKKTKSKHFTPKNRFIKPLLRYDFLSL